MGGVAAGQHNLRLLQLCTMQSVLVCPCFHERDNCSAQQSVQIVCHTLANALTAGPLAAVQDLHARHIMASCPHRPFDQAHHASNTCHCLWCRSPSPYVFLVRTVDLTPPVFVGATPRVQDIAATSFELVVQMNKAGLVFYVVLIQVRCCMDAALSAAWMQL